MLVRQVFDLNLSFDEEHEERYFRTTLVDHWSTKTETDQRCLESRPGVQVVPNLATLACGPTFQVYNEILYTVLCVLLAVLQFETYFRCMGEEMDH